ncbi:MAG: response regulator [Crocinitomicaceae bacterium]|nr:response regulator [Crocinitomicaceae bacterium]
MKKELHLLYVEDDRENRESLVKLLSDETIGDYTIKIKGIESFDKAFDEIKDNDYHIVILDIYRGNPKDNGEQAGLKVLKEIQNKCFVPVIFYSGNTQNVKDLKSQIVGVVTKGDDGVEGLKKEIERLAKFNLPFVKEKLHNYLEEELKTYFWDIIHNERNKFTATQNDFSLGYLMLRKFGNSLSKEKISEILGDGELKKDKVHSMEFYLYPTDTNAEYESGEILQKDNDVFIILTPSCDFIDRGEGRRTVGKVLLAKTDLLTNTNEYKLYANKKKEGGTTDKSNKEQESDKKNLIKTITSGRSDRYFFLPQTPFIENRVIDFQIKEMVDYDSLRDYTRLTKLDNPYAEGMTASFIRYYNRIGYPDIDSDLILSYL